MRIACLHTAESNIAIFAKAAASLGLPLGTLQHTVRADLLLAAEKIGFVTDDIAEETRGVLRDLSQTADAVILNCSTLGPSAVTLANTLSVPVLRVDAALARKAAAYGGKLVALCTVETSMAPTSQLFNEAASHTGSQVETRLVAGAWEKFRAGDRDSYLALIAAAADKAYADGASVVALAQASMTDAATLVRHQPQPLTSPVASLTEAIEQLAKVS